MSNTNSQNAAMTTAAVAAAAPPPLRISLIAAVTRSNGLGVDGGLPWTLPKEMAHFRRCTTYLPSPASSSSPPAPPFDVSSASTSASTSAPVPASRSSASTIVSEKKAERRNAVIMGRNTWESIPDKFRPLKGRWNVVVSRSLSRERLGKSAGETSEGDIPQTSLATSFQAALDHMSALQAADVLGRIFLIGGAQLYAEALRTLPQTSSDIHPSGFTLDTLLITRLKSHLPCDVFLPEFRSDAQIAADETGSEEERSASAFSSGSEAPYRASTDRTEDARSKGQWLRASHERFSEWLGGTTGKDALPVGPIEEKGLQYELQMWTPAHGSGAE